MKKPYKKPETKHRAILSSTSMLESSYIDFGYTGDFDVKEERDEYTWTDLEW
ncbi:MAG: hypothetical protein MJZ60_01810 [Bacteroidaceae bacterium]|nr:hypothetical protein [Bacteroidaceae bacterium]